MATIPRILAFAGSTRTHSYNKRLVQVAARAAEEAGAQVTVIDLRDLALPLFDQDLEAAEGPPENARKLKALMKESDGFLISSPEYNSSVSAVLKNAIDWASRPTQEEPPAAVFRGKVAAIMSASPGALGGLRGLVTLRSILGNIGVIVLPEQAAVSVSDEAFSADGALVDTRRHESVRALGQRLATFLQKLKA